MTGGVSDTTAEGVPMRFEFGRNWRDYLTVLDEDRIEQADRSLVTMLERPELAGASFLDVGSGSGLFSLAARRRGARVHSFDIDDDSVVATTSLRERYFPGDPHWTVERGSVLDDNYLRQIGDFDIVYSWGVLHHTGRLWEAIANAAARVRPNGQLFIALYNDCGFSTRVWTAVKWSYNALPPSLRWLVLGPATLRLWGPRIAIDTLRGDPLATWRSYRTWRGMSAWHDVVDWVGGYPFEASKPEDVTAFLEQRGFVPMHVKVLGGAGCNEFVFRRT